MSCCRKMIVLTAVWLVVCAAASPVKRSPDIAARRRSAIDRSMIRLGRSYPQEPSAAELREVFQSPVTRGNSFLRFGRYQPLTFSTDDLIALLKAYEEQDDVPSKKSPSFIRFGRDPAFIRFGRSADESADKSSYEQASDLVVGGFPQRKNRARNHFIRLGRDSEELNDVSEEEDSRKKRSAGACEGC